MTRPRTTPFATSPERSSRHPWPWAGVHLTPLTAQELIDRILDAIAARSALTVTYLNPFYARRTAAEPALAEVVDGFDVVQPDGWGVVYGARLAGLPVPERVAIEDIERDLFDRMAEDGRSVFLFGSEPGIADRAAETLRRAFPGLEVAGTQHGWLDVAAGHPGRFDPRDEAMVVERIRSALPDLLLVGLPTPLQQQWVQDHGAAGAGVVMTVGAYLDKLAEGLDWYPPWMNRVRLGWLYRVVREPRRLLGRYTVGMVDFGRLVAREAVTARRHA